MNYRPPDYADAAAYEPAPYDLSLEDLAAEEHAAARRERQLRSLRPIGFIEWFVIAQTALPALLYIPGSQAYRLPIRVGAYGMTLLAFAIWWFDRGGRRDVSHPAQRWLFWVVVLLVLMIFHPGTPSPLAGVAQTTLYFSIFSAMFWSAAFIKEPRQLVRILAILLVCNGINSIVGVLQVYDPAHWMPRELSAAFTLNRNAMAAATFVGPNGRILIRPPGLFDTPGAVCGPGTIAALLGLVFALEPVDWWKRAVSLGMALAGVSAIYLSHVRSNLVVAIAMMIVYAAMLGMRGQKVKSITFLSACGALIVTGFTAATILGGEGIRDRFMTLLADDPRTIYYNNRGQQLQNSLGDIAQQYPFGAGLARWGMIHEYFGDPVAFDGQQLWAEEQPNAWMLDGGYFLVGLYGLALIVTAVHELKILRDLQDPQEQAWAAAVVAANLGTLAFVFTFVPFATQMGLQFWFLEGALHGATARRLHGDDE